MTQSRDGGEEDALDRLIRRRVFEPVTPEGDEDAPAIPADAGDRRVGRVDPGGSAVPRDLVAETEPASDPISEGQPAGARPQGGYAEPPSRIVRRARPVSSGSPEGGLTDWDQLRQSFYFRFLALAIALVVVFFVARAIATGLSGGANSLFERLIALDAPFPPVPGPDDPVVVASIDLRAAARVAAPLVLAVVWLMGGYQIDRAARRALRVGGPPGTRLPFGYGVAAVGCVFPLFIFGIAGLAWGGINLAVWTIRHQAWGPTGMLLALLAAFALLIRGLVAWRERQDPEDYLPGP